MRLYPLGTVLIRQCVEATTVAGRAVPKGTIVHVDVMNMHRCADYFPEPEAYRPERFIEAAAAGNPDLHAGYLPFGLGPHNCIGWRFAMEEGVIMLVRLYQRYLFRLSETHHPGGVMNLRSSLTIAPKGGLWVKAVAR